MTHAPHWHERRAGDLRRAGVSTLDQDRSALYRPNELLLDAGSVDLLRSETGDARVRPDDERNHRLSRAGVDLQRWVLPDGIDLPALRGRLAGRLRGTSFVELNHVFTGEPFYMGGPGGEPDPCDAPALPTSPGGWGTAAALAVLDTGLPMPRPQGLLASLVADDASEVDLLNADDDAWLDTEAGHGTFIGGLVQRVTGGLAVEQRRVLDSFGFGDDLTVCLGLAETRAPVVNLSLGGYTSHDRPPSALAAAVAARRHDTVVVAAAGNNAGDRAFWPAAIQGVIAVAAYDSRAGGPATFSNHGPWVDVCAPGVALRSCYVTGTRRVGTLDVAFDGGASWSGTSFAAPLVAAEIARRLVADPSRTPRQVADDLLGELPAAPWPGFGKRYEPDVDLTL